MRRLGLVAVLAAAGCGGQGGGGSAIELVLDAPAAAVAGPVLVTAVPGGPARVRRVEFSLDALPLDVDVTSPFTVTLAPGAVADGLHTVGARAIAVDGEEANALASVILDNAAPTVTIVEPRVARVLPPGEVTVRLVADDPAGTAAGRLRLDGGAPVALDDSLAATLRLPPAHEFPADHLVSWEVDDTAGNRATGEVPLALTHVRATHRFEVTGDLAPVFSSGGGLLFSAGRRIIAFDADDRERWDVDTGWQVGGLTPTADGGALAVLFEEGRLPGAFVRRLGPDGATVFEAPDIDDAVYAYLLPAEDETLAARVELGSNPVQCSLVRLDGNGSEQPLVALPAGWVARRIAQWDVDSGGGIAVLLADVTGTSWPRLATFDREGHERWSIGLPEGNHAVVQMWPLGADRVVLAFLELDTEEIVIRAFGPQGEEWSLAEEPGETFESGRIEGGALWLQSQILHVQSVLRRVEPAGSVSLHSVFDDAIWYWAVAADGGFLVDFAESLVRFDRSGEQRWRFELPAGEETTILAGAALLADGSTWAMAPGVGHPERIFRLDSSGEPIFLQRLPAGHDLGMVAGDDGRLLVLHHVAFTDEDAEIVDVSVIQP